MHETGYLTKENGRWKHFHYFIKDHLGNNRLVVNQSGAIVQSLQYEPFGMTFADGINAGWQPYKFGGKEEETDCRLNWYDFESRLYVPDLGRFMQPDPMAEKYYSVSPYAYCGNNPVRYVDPTGMEIIFIIRDQGKQTHYRYRDGAFWNADGKKYEPNNENKAYFAMNQTLNAFQTIEKSGEESLINQLQTLVTTKNKHYMEEVSNYEMSSNVKPYDQSIFPNEEERRVKANESIGSRAYLNFSEKGTKNFEKSEGVTRTNFTTIAHEMQHQFDIETGNWADKVKNGGASDPTEIRAVTNENIIRKLKGLPLRTTYGGAKINFNKK